MIFKKRRYIQSIGCKEGVVFDILDKIKEYTPNYNKDLIFVDVFGGGGAVSANATYYFNNIIYNEIDKKIVEAFVKIQDDNIIQALKEKLVSREEFIRIKNKKDKTVIDNILLVIWIIFSKTKNTQSLKILKSLEVLEKLKKIEELEGLNNYEDNILKIDNSKIIINNKDYRELKLPTPNECVLYLDPPYDTSSQSHYKNDIDYDNFIKWIKDKKKEGYNIFLSEYSFPFGKKIWENQKKNL